MITEFLKSLEATGLAEQIRSSLYLFPLLEAVHVIGLALVFGTILVIDLRLLGIASTERPFNLIASDILKWTWVAFALTAVTGSLMFITNAEVYFNNIYFRLKMILLALSGVNMAAFEVTARRSVATWNQSRSAPRSGRAVAIASIVIWIAVIFMGRMIGFTATRGTTSEPPPADVDFEDFLGGPDEPPPAQ
jgi:hypothetical protein